MNRRIKFSHLPDELFKYWLRGFLDGDGCIYIGCGTGKVSFYSAFDQDWFFMETILKRMNIKFYISRQERIQKKYKKKYESFREDTKSSSINIQNIPDARKLCNFIYDGWESDEIGLLRKYEKYLKLIPLTCREKALARKCGGLEL